jgi:hypothetical protein
LHIAAMSTELKIDITEMSAGTARPIRASSATSLRPQPHRR